MPNLSVRSVPTSKEFMVATKTNKDNLELILYRLDDLQRTVTTGFQRLDLQGQDLIKRVSVLEIWQAKVDTDLTTITAAIDNLKDSSSNTDKWAKSYSKIILQILTILGLLATVLLQLASRR